MNSPAASIKTVVFDLGKVLVDFDYSIAVRRLAGRAKMRVEEFADFITHAPLLLQYESGVLTSRQFYDAICSVTGFCGDMNEFAALFGDIFSPIQPMIELHGALRREGCQTYIFSNTNELAVRHIRKAFPFFSDFDGYILSFEIGSMKPEPKMYEVLESTSGSRAGEILYLDDRPENVQAGAARGWQVILHQTAAQSIRRIRELGLLDSQF